MKGPSEARGTAHLTKKFAQGPGFDKFCKFAELPGWEVVTVGIDWDITCWSGYFIKTMKIAIHINQNLILSFVGFKAKD